MVIDTSVWVASFLPDEKHHDDAVSCLGRVVELDIHVALPILALAEIGGAIARRSGSTQTATRIIAFVQAQPWIEFAPIDTALGKAAGQLAIRQRLRGADAIYVALASQREKILITLDQEMLERTPAGVTARTPADWLLHG